MNRRIRSQALAAVIALAATFACKSTERPLSAQAQHGHELYLRMCAVCHGESGQGYKADQAPRLADPDFLASASDQLLRITIENGRGGTTMSAWAKERGGPLDHSDVAAVIAYLETWAQSPRILLDERAAKGDAVRGAALYARECESCHGPRGVNGKEVHVGGPDLLENASVGYLRYAIRVGRAGTPMKGFGEKLDDQAIDDLLVLLASWKPVPPQPQREVVRPPPIPLGPVPLNPHGPPPQGFKPFPATTPVDVVKAEMDRHAKLALLDARAPSDYMREHIAGAVSVPFYDPSPYLAKLPKDAWLIAYCSCPHAESTTLARVLTQNGFQHVTVLDEGLGVWKNKKYPTNTGDQP